MASSQKTDYVLGGSTFSNARLDLQYFQFTHALGGHHIDPSIDYKAPNLKIADVCCGTGLFFISLNPHPTTELHALDINLSSLPPPSWLPNITRHTYNINDPPPTPLLAKFDIINLQLAWTFISDSGFDGVFSNILAMLKPGGHIQWTECNPLGVQALCPDPEYESRFMVRLYKDSYDILGMKLPTWPGKLDEVFARNGVDVLGTVKPGIDYSMLQSWTRQQMTTWQEVVEMLWGSVKGDEGKRKSVEGFEDCLGEARREVAERGCGYFLPIVRVIGRKKGGDGQ